MMLLPQTGKIETMLQNIAKRNFIPIDTDVFWEGGHLVASVEMGNSFDIIFLDIEMGEEDRYYSEHGEFGRLIKRF